jgi:hypothetical protein
MAAENATRAIERDNFYDPTKPLTQEHYDAQRRAAQTWEDKTNKLAHLQQLEDQMRKHISLAFWKEVCSVYCIETHLNYR